MNKIRVETLKDVAPHVKEHLLPEIHAAVDTCIESYEADPFNDSWTFGTHLWRNLWNRLKTVAELNDCPFELYGKGNEYKLKIGRFILRHHKINNKTKLPSGAKAVKKAASVQMTIYSFLGEAAPEQPSIDNIVIAINATVKSGLTEVFIGELLPTALDSNEYEWKNEAQVYLADGCEPSKDRYVHRLSMVSTHTPIEQIPEPALKLVRPNQKEINNTDFK